MALQTTTMLRTNVINALISRHGLKSYLEIGVQNPAKNFNLINCGYKVGVDPDPVAMAAHCMTSDQYFKEYNEKFDIVFIDGLHEEPQVDKDLANSLKALNEGGFIVMHDCNPSTKKMQQVPRVQSEWTGDTWKSFVKLRQQPGYIMYVVDTDYGVGVITRGTQQPLFAVGNPSYEQFDRNRAVWLNLISAKQFNLLYK